MAQTSTNTFVTRSGNRDGGARQLLARAVAWIAEQRRVNRTIAKLSDLSDHTLADIGIDRLDIPRIARYGRNAPGSR